MIKTCVASIIACKTKEDERAEGKEEVRVMMVSEPVNFIHSESGIIKSTRLYGDGSWVVMGNS